MKRLDAILDFAFAILDFAFIAVNGAIKIAWFAVLPSIGLLWLMGWL